MSERYGSVGDLTRATVTSQLSSEPAEAWMAKRLCDDKQYDPELWFADSSEGRGQKVALAKAICAECAVSTACLEFSIRSKAAHGIWGGLTAAERTRMIRPSKGSILKCRFCGDEFRAPTGNYRYCEKHRTNVDRSAVAKRAAA